MTTPVLTKSTPEKTDMTTPVLTTKGNDGGSRVTMEFILSAKFKMTEEVPTPVDERVVIKEEGERKCGVVTFSGVATEKVVAEKVNELKKDLERDVLGIIRPGSHCLLSGLMKL